MKARPSKSLIVTRLLRSPGLRAAINAHCVQCIYDEHEKGSYKHQIACCSVIACALHSYRCRPRQSKGKIQGGLGE